MELPDELKIPDDILEKLRRPDELRKSIEEGKCLREILGYSDELMESLYQAARRVFQEGRYTEAQDAFLFLTTLNPFVYAYWLGLGMAYQYLEDFEQAILSYECASKVEPESPIPLYYEGVCHGLVNEYEIAEELLHAARERCHLRAEYRDLVQKIQHAEEKFSRKNG